MYLILPPCPLSRRAGIQAILFGHDHLSCFSGTLDGVRLAYG